MVEGDRKRFAELLVVTGEVYDRKVSTALATIFFDDMKGYQIREVEAAFAAHRRDPDRGRFFPKPGDIVHQIEGSSTDRAALAWGEVQRLARDSRNAYSDDPAVERAVADLGGWLRIGRAGDREMSFMAREFERLYDGHRRRVASVRALAAPGPGGFPELLTENGGEQ